MHILQHDFVFFEENDTNHVFVCSKCNTIVGFNKPGVGFPNAILTDDIPIPPSNVNQYVNPCEAE